MEQHKAVHYEIQGENSNGTWFELPLQRPQNEEEIPELYNRARASFSVEEIRVVKVTTTVTVERLSEEFHATLNSRVPLHELLQDCD